MDYGKAVALAKEGKETGFQYLYESTYKSKYYLAVKYMKDEDAAQDVLQDAYMKAFSQLDTLENPEAFPSWLGIIVGNTAKNALKKHNPLLFSEVTVENDEEPFEYEIADENTQFQPEVSYTQKETQMLVREMIDSLSEEQRICILMFEIEGIPIKDIAAALQCSENTVKSRLNYGRKNLKKKAEALEKKGYKLYSLAPLPLLLWLLRSEKSVLESEGVLETAQAQAGGAIMEQALKTAQRAASGAAKTAASGAANTVAAGAAKGAASGAIKSGFLHSVAGKITAAVLSITVAGSAVTYGVHQAHKKPELPVNEPTQATQTVQQETTPETQPEQTEATEPQQTGPRQMTDADYPQLIVGNLTKEELKFAFAYGPTVMSEADQTYHGKTFDDYVPILLNQYYDRAAAGCYDPSAKLPHPDAVIACYGIDENSKLQMSRPDVNRMLALFTDYQITEENHLPTDRIEDDIIHCGMIATTGMHPSVTIQSAEYTDEKMTICYHYDCRYADPQREADSLNLQATLRPIADGKYRVVQIEKAPSQMEKVMSQIYQTREDAYQALLDQLRNMKPEEIFTDYVEDWEESWPTYVEYMKENPDLRYIYQDMDGDGEPELLVSTPGVTDQGTQVIDVCHTYYCKEADGGYALAQADGWFSAYTRQINGYGLITSSFSRGTGERSYSRTILKDGAMTFESIPEYTHFMGTQEEEAIVEKIRAETEKVEWISLS